MADRVAKAGLEGASGDITGPPTGTVFSVAFRRMVSSYVPIQYRPSNRHPKLYSKFPVAFFYGFVVPIRP